MCVSVYMMIQILCLGVYQHLHLHVQTPHLFVLFLCCHLPILTVSHPRPPRHPRSSCTSLFLTPHKQPQSSELSELAQHCPCPALHHILSWIMALTSHLVLGCPAPCPLTFRLCPRASGSSGRKKSCQWLTAKIPCGICHSLDPKLHQAADVLPSDHCPSPLRPAPMLQQPGGVLWFPGSTTSECLCRLPCRGLFPLEMVDIKPCLLHSPWKHHCHHCL